MGDLIRGVIHNIVRSVLCIVSFIIILILAPDILDLLIGLVNKL